MHIVRPNAQLILPNSKILGRKIKTLGETKFLISNWLHEFKCFNIFFNDFSTGDKLREMNVFS